MENIKILVQGKKREDFLYRCRCPLCHCVFEGKAKDISVDSEGLLKTIFCPSCMGVFITENLDVNGENDEIKCVDPNINDFDSDKKFGFQKNRKDI